MTFEPGCYADATFGMDHVYAVLADLVEDYDSEIAGALREGWAENGREWAHEVADDALEVLNSYVPDGLVWTFESGDLLLIAEDEAFDTPTGEWGE